MSRFPPRRSAGLVLVLALSACATAPPPEATEADPGLVSDWARAYFAASDDASRTGDLAPFLAYLDPDVRFRFSNAPEVVGTLAVETELASFFGLAGEMSHDLIGEWRGDWAGGRAVSVEALVTYRPPDGPTVTLPVTTTLRLDREPEAGGRVLDVRVFMDLTPLAD